MKKTFLIALWLMASAGALAAKEEPPVLAADLQAGLANALLIRADEARDAGNEQVALSLYQEALAGYQLLSKNHPDWQPGMVRFRTTYCQNQLESARTTALPAPPELPQDAPSPPPAVSPDNGPALISQAKDLLGEGKPMEARELLLEALRQRPGNLEARLLLTQALCQAGLFQDALSLARGILQNNPAHARAMVLAGTAYFGLGKPAEAEARLREALAVDPNMAEAHFNLAQVLLHGSAPDLGQIRQHYKRALDGGILPDPRLDTLIQKQP